MHSLPILSTAPVVSPARVIPPGATALHRLAVSVGLEAQLFVNDLGDVVVEAWRVRRDPAAAMAMRIAWVGQRAQRGMLYDGNPYGMTTNVTTLTALLKAMVTA